MSLQRTQVLLEPWQHAKLKTLADEQGRSMSEVVRDMVTAGLEKTPTKKKGIMAIVGIVSGGPLTNQEMDDIIYRKDWE